MPTLWANGLVCQEYVFTHCKLIMSPNSPSNPMDARLTIMVKIVAGLLAG